MAEFNISMEVGKMWVSAGADRINGGGQGRAREGIGKGEGPSPSVVFTKDSLKCV